MGEPIHLLPFEAAALRDAAAADVFSRLRRLQGLAPEKVRPLLAYLEGHLFDPQLSVAHLLRACQLRGRGAIVAFGKFVGKGPKSFIEECRHETAKELLAASLLPVTEIAGLVGFSGLDHFLKSFERLAGETPSSYREKASRAGGAGEAERAVRVATCDKVLRQELDDAARETLARYILLTHPDVSPGEAVPEPASPRVDGPGFEEGLAATMWEELAPLPPELRRARVLRGYRYREPVLFHLLCRKSREVALRDAHEAYALARLALVSLEFLVEPLPPAKYAELQALGHAWMGHAQRLLFDLTGAEQSFAVAEAYLLGCPEAPLAQARVSLLKAYLRWWQRQLPQAHSLANRAIELFCASGTADEQAEVLVLRALLHRHQGTLKAAVQELVAVERRITAESPLHLQVAVFLNLTRCYLEAGEPRKALEYLPRAQGMAEQLGNPHVRCLLTWLEGSIAQTLGHEAEAEAGFLAAWRGFREIHQPTYAGLAGIDLAFLYVKQARSAEVIPLLAQVLPWLAILELQDEVGVALELLQEAMRAGKTTLSVLAEMRSVLRRVERELLPNGC